MTQRQTASSSSEVQPHGGGEVRNSSRVQCPMFVPRVNGKEMSMRKLQMGTVILFLAATMPIAQARQSSDQQSAGDQAQGAASSAAGAVKQGAETGANKPKEGAQKAYGAAKDAVTGKS